MLSDIPFSGHGQQLTRTNRHISVLVPVRTCASYPDYMECYVPIDTGVYHELHHVTIFADVYTHLFIRNATLRLHVTYYLVLPPRVVSNWRTLE